MKDFERGNLDQNPPCFDFDNQELKNALQGHQNAVYKKTAASEKSPIDFLTLLLLDSI